MGKMEEEIRWILYFIGESLYPV